MAGAPVSLTEAISTGIEAALDDIFVARPGKIVTYDPLTNTAFVKPMVKRALYAPDGGARSYEELPEIPFVPVLFPRVGAYAMTMPVAPGDTVLLVFCDVSLAEWRDTGQVAEPVDARRHSIGWPVAIPGFYPSKMPLSANPIDLLARATAMILGQHGGNGRIEIDPTFIKLGKDAIDFVALATPTQAGLVACMAAANAALALASSVKASLDGHTHAGVAAGAATSGPPTYVTALPSVPAAGGAPGAVAATRTKAK